MNRTRRNHSPKVKAAAALDALKSEKTFSSLDCQTPEDVNLKNSLKNNVA